MGLIGDWRAARMRRRLAEDYLRRVLTAPDSADVSWLTSLVNSSAAAERELKFARRALGLIVAERDALDDRTASDVVHALSSRVETEARHDPADAALWVARRREYSQALSVRGQSDAPAVRMARVLLEGAGVPVLTPETVMRASAVIQTERTRANEVLRTVFGEASLPEDVRPSSLRT